MRGHTKFLGRFDKNRRGKAFRGPVTEGCHMKRTATHSCKRRANPRGSPGGRSGLELTDT